MADELWKYLQHTPATLKKPLGAKRKAEMADKEVLNITRGLFPLRLVEQEHIENFNQSNRKWIYTPIVQKNTSIGPIYHWALEGEEKKLYHGEKFNVEPNVVTFTFQEFQAISHKVPGISFQQANQLFEVLRRYNVNFIVAEDRFESGWTIEDLKQMYFTISRQILLLRGQEEESLAQFVFDKKYECNRKFELQKYLMRNKLDTDRQKSLVSEIRRLQILIKKEERDQVNLKKALKLEDVVEDVFDLSNVVNLNVLYSSQRVYSRQQHLSKLLTLPGKVNQRLSEVLAGMNIPEKIIANQQNTELYDSLRQKILLMFSIQRYIRKKETERRVLEEKKKRLLNQEEDEKKTYLNKQPDGAPKKKIHINKI